MEWIEKILAILKLPSRYFITFFVISLFLLLAPENILQLLSLTDFVIKYRPYIAIVFLLSVVLLSMEIALFISRHIASMVHLKKIKRKSILRLLTLDSEEKAILREFVIQNKNTLLLPITYPSVEGLLTSGVLKVIGTYGRLSTVGMLHNVIISESIKPFLTFDQIGLPNELTPPIIEKLRKSRPGFIATVEYEVSLLEGRL